jgi:putative hydrolase of the HAD superfamily
MFPFDVILFDVGGVLLTNGWDHRERAAVRSNSSGSGGVRGRHAAHYDAWERDEINCRDAYLDATVFYEPRSFSHVATEFFDACCAQSKLLAGWGAGNP